MTVGMVAVVKAAIAQVVGFNFLDIVVQSQTHSEISRKPMLERDSTVQEEEER